MFYSITHRSIYLSIYVPVYLSINLPVFLSTLVSLSLSLSLHRTSKNTCSLLNAQQWQTQHKGTSEEQNGQVFPFFFTGDLSLLLDLSALISSLSSIASSNPCSSSSSVLLQRHYHSSLFLFSSIHLLPVLAPFLLPFTRSSVPLSLSLPSGRFTLVPFSFSLFLIS